MHGECKGSEVIEIPQANQMIKDDIENTIKKRLLKRDRSDGILMDIRHTKLVIDQSRNRLIKEIRDSFEELIYR